MKIFHTADWHIGKTVNGFSMIEQQRSVLEQLIADVKRERPDALMIAGDLYDSAVPSAAAVDLLDEVLFELVIRCNVPVLAIAGNHDSPTRIDYASGIVKAAGLHIAGHLPTSWQPVVLHDEHGEVHFHLVPYADPVIVRDWFHDESIKSHDDAMRAITDHLRSQMKTGVRHVFIGHAFVTPNGEPADNTSESEKKLNAVGGAEQVSATHFAGFDYVALGHLHRAHQVGSSHIRYAGSIVKYSKSEATHHKGYTVVELQADGSVQIEERSLVAKHDMRLVEGMMADIESRETSDDYVFVTLLDDHYVVNFVDRVRKVFPNVMAVERRQAREQFLQTTKGTTERTNMSPLELLHQFYQDIIEEPPSEQTIALFTDVMATIERKEREVE
jgi:exonuclease SbcD